MHPQYLNDIREIRRIKERGLTGGEPARHDIPAIASLMMRYRHLPLFDPICQELSQTMQLWGMDPEALNFAARGIWNAGYRPDAYDDQEEAPKVGSHFDTRDDG